MVASETSTSPLSFPRRVGEALTVTVLETGTYFRVAHDREPLPAIAFQLDGEIPFLPDTVWLYLLGYAGCLLVTIWCVRGPREFRAALASFALAALLSLPFFALLPIRSPRPIAPEAAGVTAALVRWLFRVDPELNTFPSLHVANVVLCACVVRRSDARAGAGVAILAFAVAVSTLTLKQHWLVDLPAGGALGLFCYAAWRLLIRLDLRALMPPRTES